ncbi:hypothetical protein ACKI1I_43180 [Streptomyces turgidiscabies]|uniref:hypothetical protein n=1 Tax=Streptomyces TaxID=1883 RepID=UPI002119D177|nr:hypothetical protein [Streptomyces sp. NBC_01571]MCQ9179052.1 hypothetical protein [Streptomyces hayashii]MCX4573299.1 hypothetical protein [Streptomyces sp. NBC_01571]
MPQPPSTTSTRDQEHTIDVVRVVVRLRGEQEPEDPTYVTFELDLLGAPLPQDSDVICLGSYHFQVRSRRYHVSTAQHEPPKVVLHVGITGRRPADLVTAAALTRDLKAYPSVASIH